MHIMWWAIFIVSASLLVVLLLRRQHSARWLAYVGLNAVFAALLLYAVNWLGAGYDFRIPINAVTVATVGVLGVPGLLMLAAVKLTLIS